MITKKQLEELAESTPNEVLSLLVDALEAAASRAAHRGRYELSSQFDAVARTLDEATSWDPDDAGFELDDDVLEILRNPEER